MAEIAEGKKRLIITMDADLVAKIEKYCMEHGRITKSDYFTRLAVLSLTSADTLPELLSDAFVRSAMTAELGSMMREVLEAQRALGLA